MKKKALLVILAILLIAACTVAIVACDDTPTDNKQDETEWGTVYTVDAAYARATDLGYSGSLEEFINLIKGKDGADGKDGTNGVDGKDGKDGINGTNGKDGKDGIDGTNGKDGKDGINGTNGKDGKDGVGIVSIETDSAGNLIISLTNSKVIKLESVFKCTHSFSEWSIVLKPTCTSVGCNVRTCTKCGNKEYKFFEELGHVWDDGETVFDASCDKNGLKIYTCLSCGTTKSEILTKRHNYVGDVCTDCGKPKPTEDALMFTLNSDCASYGVRARNKEVTRVVIPETYNDLPVTQINSSAFVDCRELESVFIPESITRIDNNTFLCCPKLKTINIPKSVTRIGDNFAVYNYLESITVEDGNPVYHSAGNCLIETQSKTLMTGCKNSMIPDDGSVVKIKSMAFFRSEITSIVIPKSIVEIESMAFRECTKLKVVYNLSDLDIVCGSITNGNVAYFADEVYTSLDINVA